VTISHIERRIAMTIERVFSSLFFFMFGSVSATENTTAKTVEVKRVELFKVEFFLKFNCF
jgi:hypothetical protein